MVKNKLSKVLCSIVMFAVMLVNVGLGVNAAMQLDPNDNIKFSEELTNGKGVIEVTRDVPNYQLFYQLVEANDDTYSRIVKIKETLRVIQALRLYELETNEQNYIRYIALQDQFEAKYGERVQNGTEADVEAYLNELNNLLSSTMYNEDNWIRTTSNMFEIDASQFAGNKNYLVWVKLVNADTNAIAYDADIYRIEGTGNNNNNNNDNNDDNNNTTNTTENTISENTISNETTNNTTKNNTTNTANTSSSNSTSNTNSSKTTSTSSDINTTKDSSTAKKSIPQTGAVDIYVVAGIGMIAVAVGTVSFIRYRKIK